MKKLVYCTSRAKARRLATNGRKVIDNGTDSQTKRRWAVSLADTNKG